MCEYSRVYCKLCKYSIEDMITDMLSNYPFIHFRTIWLELNERLKEQGRAKLKKDEVQKIVDKMIQEKSIIYEDEYSTYHLPLVFVDDEDGGRLI